MTSALDAVRYRAAVLSGRVFGPLLRPAIEERLSQIEFLAPASGRVVFLGDSITFNGMWDEWFPDIPTSNRGIGGDTICGVAKRLDSALIEPRAVSLLIGTNDLAGLGASVRVSDVADRMRALVARIRDQMPPSAPLLINSVMPRTSGFTTVVSRLNDEYQRIAAAADAEYVDLWPALATARGTLRSDYTRDGLHLNGAGYREWVEVLRPRLQSV